MRRHFMRLADFILANIEPIIQEWVNFARTIIPGASMTTLTLRDSAEEILRSTAGDMVTEQTPQQQTDKSHGRGESGKSHEAVNDAAAVHAAARLKSGFDIEEMLSEYRALRACVLRLWRESLPTAHAADIDDIIRFNEALDQSITRAIQCFNRDHQKSHEMFLAMLGHDLRTPLVAIRLSGHILAQARYDDPQLAHLASQVPVSAEVMDRMIRDLLLFARARLGSGLPLQKERVDLDRLCKLVIDEARIAYPSRRIDVDCPKPIEGQWDADRLRQAVSNLVINALKFGEESAPVELRLDADATQATITVHNSGKPIPPEILPRIFSPLVRAPTGGGETTGVGLGLFIARTVVDAHGGSAEVRSTAEHGTHFILRLPLAER